MNIRALLLCLSWASLPAQSFAVQTITLPAATNATCLAAGDLNGDGWPDLAILGGDGLIALFADGTGGYVRQVLTQPIVWARDVQLADANGDGSLDVWFATLFGQSLMLGDGAGGSAPAAPLGAGNNNLSIGDVDEDGDPDFVTALGTNAVAVGKNNGDGTFTAPLTVASATAFTYVATLLRDMNEDGHLDIVARGFVPTVSLLFGDGSGNFAVQPGLSLGGGADNLALADLDGDSFTDLAVGYANAGVLTQTQIWLNDGAGSLHFASLVPAPSMRLAGAADLDADGDVDLIGHTIYSVVVHWNDGEGGFGPAESYATPQISSLAMADFDLDGRTDIAVIPYPGQQLIMLRNVAPVPAGLQAYGAGTPTCRGTMTMWAPLEPEVGASAFRIACSNLPPDSTGLLALGTQHLPGWDPLGLGITLHLGFALPIGTMRSDAGGAATFGLPIPPLSFLSGLTVHTQSVWFGDAGFGNTCSPGIFELASSRGLSITIQP